MTQPELPFGDSHDDPSESATRLVWSLITLLRFRRIDFDSVLRTFDSFRSEPFDAILRNCARSCSTMIWAAALRAPAKTSTCSLK